MCVCAPLIPKNNTVHANAGIQQLAIEAYAEALEAIPLTIAENSGLDPIDIMVELRSKHANPENKWYGVQVKTGKIADMLADNIVEPLRVKQQAAKSIVADHWMIS